MQIPKSLDIHIYDVVQGDGYDFWTGETVESDTSANHIKNLLTENEDIENINIYINSAGGSVYEGLAIYNQLKRHKAYKTVYVDGFACSIASVIAMSGDKVVMPKTSMLMIHNAWTCAAGNAKELRKIADDLDVMSETIAQSYMEKSNGKLTAEKLQEMLDAETYIKAKDCLAYGLCDSLGDEEETVEKAKEAVQNSMRSAMANVQAMHSVNASIKAQAMHSARNLAPEAVAETAEEAEPEQPDTKPAETPETQEEPAEPVTESKDENPLDTFMKLFIRKAV